MQTRLIFPYSQKNLEILIKRFNNKYKKIEELFQEVQRDQCNKPDKLDDYMLWHLINSQEKEQKAEAGSNQDGTVELPQISFREEIIILNTDFYQVFTPRRMELLEHIQAHNPSSVKGLAAETGRDYKNVYDDLLALERFNLLDMVREGKNKRPISRLSVIEIMIGK